MLHRLFISDGYLLRILNSIGLLLDALLAFFTVAHLFTADASCSGAETAVLVTTVHSTGLAHAESLVHSNYAHVSCPWHADAELVC